MASESKVTQIQADKVKAMVRVQETLKRLEIMAERDPALMLGAVHTIVECAYSADHKQFLTNLMALDERAAAVVYACLDIGLQVYGMKTGQDLIPKIRAAHETAPVARSNQV